MTKEIPASQAAWIGALKEVESTQGETPGKDFITMKQFAKLIGRSESHSNKLMNVLLDANKAEKQPYAIVTQSGLRKIIYYRLK